MPKHYLRHIDDHLVIARDHLPAQYQARPKLNSLLTALLAPLQELEGKLYEVYLNQALTVASHHYLDRLGEIVGESRNYRLDEEYRLAITARILINNGGGTPEDLLSALRSTFRPQALHYAETYPAGSYIFLQGLDLGHHDQHLARLLTPIGTSNFVVTYSDLEPPLKLAEDCRAAGELEYQTHEVLGLGEIIISRSSLTLSSGEAYQMASDHLPGTTASYDEFMAYLTFSDTGCCFDNHHPLIITASYDEFVVQGGSKLAEVMYV